MFVLHSLDFVFLNSLRRYSFLSFKPSSHSSSWNLYQSSHFFSSHLLHHRLSLSTLSLSLSLKPCSVRRFRSSISLCVCLPLKQKYDLLSNPNINMRSWSIFRFIFWFKIFLFSQHTLVQKIWKMNPNPNVFVWIVNYATFSHGAHCKILKETFAGSLDFEGERKWKQCVSQEWTWDVYNMP